jgi:hypothetical protein
LAAAVNLARLATLGLRFTASGWQLQPAYPATTGP